LTWEKFNPTTSLALKKGGQTKFLVKWKGYTGTTWETTDKFNDTECIDDYWDNGNLSPEGDRKH
jgi:hypothetical protein